MWCAKWADPTSKELNGTVREMFRIQFEYNGEVRWPFDFTQITSPLLSGHFTNYSGILI